MTSLGKQFLLQVSWLREGRFFVTSSAAGNWKKAMFAWHEKSFYGTSLDYETYLGERGIYLQPLTALDYFATPKPLMHADIIWETPELIEVAELLQEVLAKGWFMPDASRWAGDAGQWCLEIPVSEEQRVQKALAHSKIPFYAEWLEAAIQELITQDSHINSIYGRLKRQYQALAVDRNKQELWTDEESWLEEIGFRDSPFRLLLQLQEPEELEEHWSFQIVVQDRAQLTEQWVLSARGEPLGRALPTAWQSEYLLKLQRTVEKWLMIWPELEDDEAEEPGQLRSTLDERLAWSFLTEGSVCLAEAGYTVLLPKWWDRAKIRTPQLKAHLTSTVAAAPQGMMSMNQLLQFDWRIAIGDQDVTEEEFYKLVQNRRTLFKVNNEWVAIPPNQVQRLYETIEHYRSQGLSLREVLELHLTQSDARDDAYIEEEAIGPCSLQLEMNDLLADWFTQLQEWNELPMIHPSMALKANLRQYQLEGASWMAYLGSFGLGGCLADDMGLGKTVQWIACLLHLLERESWMGPALLICPTSVLGNWQKELERFAPSLDIVIHHGSARAKGESFQQMAQAAQLVVTSYPLANQDEDELQGMEWGAICLDEAQFIKNAHTKQAIAIRKLRSNKRFALTGTPVENRLTELWSIFDFINPGYLGNQAQFQRQYVTPIERGDQERLGQLRRLIQPFLLRRTKKDPAIQLDLPEKNEMKQFVSLTQEQGAEYEGLVQHLLDRIDRLSMMERRALILTTMTRLKQACDHPALIYIDRRAKEQELQAIRPEMSIKCLRVLELIEEIRGDGEKCILFTQFVTMGRLLQVWLREKLDEPIDFLHGGVPKPQRDEMITRFQQTSGTERQHGVLILSLRAGGTGLNLTAANHVIHFDRWWNPAVENQATDRAFRIGQTKDVQVYKLIALGTLEEQIDEMLERKISVSEQVLSSGESWITELSTEEIRELFTLRRKWLEG